jgi:methionyl-tRNA formyltransferase
MWPWPRAWTSVAESTIQILEARVVDGNDLAIEPGTVISRRKQIVVACGTGALEVLTVEPAARRAMTASAYLNGLRQPLTLLGDPAVAPARKPLIVPL